MLVCDAFGDTIIALFGKFTEHVNKLKMYRTKGMQSVWLKAQPLFTGEAAGRSLPNITAV